MFSKKVVQLLIALLMLSFSNIACSDRVIVDPGGNEDHSKRELMKAIEKSAAVIVVNRDGSESFFAPKGKQIRKTCSKEQGKNQCKAFKKGSRLAGFKSTTVVMSEGTHTITIEDPDGGFIQLCFDSNWFEIPCN